MVRYHHEMYTKSSNPDHPILAEADAALYLLKARMA